MWKIEIDPSSISPHMESIKININHDLFINIISNLRREERYIKNYHVQYKETFLKKIVHKQKIQFHREKQNSMRTVDTWAHNKKAGVGFSTGHQFQFATGLKSSQFAPCHLFQFQKFCFQSPFFDVGSKLESNPT